MVACLVLNLLSLKPEFFLGKDIVFVTRACAWTELAVTAYVTGCLKDCSDVDDLHTSSVFHWI